MSSIDEQVASSGKAIFMLHSDEDALAFWNEPAKAKLVTMYMQGCGWCHRFLPEYLQMAPMNANSDLLLGSASRNHIERITQFIPSLSVQGFPTTILVDANNKVRQVIPGFMPCHKLIDLVETTLPELKGLPSLQYLLPVKQESLRKEKEELAKEEIKNNRAKLPSKTAGNVPLAPPQPPPTNTMPAPPKSDIPPGVIAGSGTVGDHALPPHLRQPVTTPETAPLNPTIVPPTAPTAQTATIRIAGGIPPAAVGVASVASGVKRHRSRHHHHRKQPVNKTGGNGNPTQSPEENAAGWCVIL